MKIEKQFLIYALLISAFFLSTNLMAQKNVLKLLPGSKKANYFETNDLLKLEGDVNFEYQSNVMYCDSAYYYEKSQFIRAYGNVHIIKENLNIFCDSAFFDAKAERSKLWGRVKMRDGDYKLTTDSIDYDSATGRATYRNHGVIQKIDSKEKITSKIGYFYPDTKNYHFHDSVRYTNDDLKMNTDTLSLTTQLIEATFLEQLPFKKTLSIYFATMAGSIPKATKGIFMETLCSWTQLEHYTRILFSITTVDKKLKLKRMFIFQSFRVICAYSPITY